MANVGNRSWADVIAARVEAGETVPRISRQYAEQVLGRRLLRGGKHAQRPDNKDKQAGQAADFVESNDDRMVVL